MDLGQRHGHDPDAPVGLDEEPAPTTRAAVPEGVTTRSVPTGGTTSSCVPLAMAFAVAGATVDGADGHPCLMEPTIWRPRPSKAMAFNAPTNDLESGVVTDKPQPVGVPGKWRDFQRANG